MSDYERMLPEEDEPGVLHNKLVKIVLRRSDISRLGHAVSRNIGHCVELQLPYHVAHRLERCIALPVILAEQAFAEELDEEAAGRAGNLTTFKEIADE